MADIICDTSFLMHMATHRVRNIDRVNTEIGDVSFVVPDVVRGELRRISGRGDARQRDAVRALEFAKRLGAVDIGSSGGGGGGGGCDVTAAHADDEILSYASAHGGIVATMDRTLKRRLKESGCAVVSFSNDNIVLEP